MSTLIRSGSSGDVEACVALWSRVIAARDGDHVLPEVERHARGAFRRSVVRFAVIGAAPDAFALTLVKQDRVALLSRLCVDTSIASRGLGTALLTDAVEHARGAGYERISLDVRQTNARAIALYARAGFTASSEPWDFDGGDAMETWSLDLSRTAGGGLRSTA